MLVTTYGIYMPASKKRAMSEVLKALIDRLPPEMEDELRDHIESLLRKAKTPRKRGNTINDLGWTTAEAAQTRSHLASFEEDWDAPGMDKYDRL
jgi:hypothetical protein